MHLCYPHLLAFKRSPPRPAAQFTEALGGCNVAGCPFKELQLQVAWVQRVQEDICCWGGAGWGGPVLFAA